MRVGTKSILFGAHCFLIHPWFVAIAWWKLYGFPFDPRLWIAFFVHDVGYIGKPNMDGPEGESHVIPGARIMSVFGPEWRDFTVYHSRYWAKRHNVNPSKLCVADKLALVITPKWLYMLSAKASGELQEYINTYRFIANQTEDEWYDEARSYLIGWVKRNKENPIHETWKKERIHE